MTLTRTNSALSLEKQEVVKARRFPNTYTMKA